MNRVVDVHSLILPNALSEHGPRTMAESVEIIKSLHEQGVTDIFSTPDVSISMNVEEWNHMDAVLHDVKLAVGEQQVDITIHNGARVMLCDEMIDYIKGHYNQYLLGTSHFMLVTVPENSKIYHINAWLLALLELGIVPIISEVEAHCQLFTKPEQLLEWVDKGILIQSSVAAFNQHHPNHKRVIELCHNGLIHFLGTGYANKDAIHAYHEYIETISNLDSTYKHDLLENLHLNERDLLADRTFYPTVPTTWIGQKSNFWTRLFGFTL